MGLKTATLAEMMPMLQSNACIWGFGSATKGTRIETFTNSKLSHDSFSFASPDGKICLPEAIAKGMTMSPLDDVLLAKWDDIWVAPLVDLPDLAGAIAMATRWCAPGPNHVKYQFFNFVQWWFYFKFGRARPPEPADRYNPKKRYCSSAAATMVDRGGIHVATIEITPIECFMMRWFAKSDIGSYDYYQLKWAEGTEPSELRDFNTWNPAEPMTHGPTL